MHFTNRNSARRRPEPPSVSAASSRQSASYPSPMQTTSSQNVGNVPMDSVIPTGIRLRVAVTPAPTSGYSNAKGKGRESGSWAYEDQVLIDQESRWPEHILDSHHFQGLQPEQPQALYATSSSVVRSPLTNLGRGVKRKRAGASSGPVAEGYPSCDNVGNTVLSCFPLGNTTLVQGIYSRFIWNANYPTFIAANAVDAYLFHADSMQVAKNWTRMPNDQGMCAILPDDDWWSDRQQARELPIGRNKTWGYYFVVVPTGDQLTGGEVHQNTFSAIQTAPPRSVLASLSSVSAASATLASLSASISRASSSSNPSTTPRADPSSGSLQNGATSGSRFPKWGIAVIVILGVLLALTLLGIAIALLRRRTRRQEQRQADEGAITDDLRSPSDGAGKTTATNTGSTAAEVGKAVRQQSCDEKEPIMNELAAVPSGTRSITPAGTTGPTTALPVLISRPSGEKPSRHTPSPVLASSGAHLRPGSRTSLYPPSVPSPAFNNPNSASATAGRQRSASYTATASSHSDQGSMTSPGGGAGAGRLSGVEAAAVADAFRQAMRKPDFTDVPTEEGESPDSENAGGLIPSTPSGIMQRELSGEGVGVRDLHSRRAYMIEGTDEDDSGEGRSRQ